MFEPISLNSLQEVHLPAPKTEQIINYTKGMAFLSKDRMSTKNLTLPLWSPSFRYMQAPHTNAYLHGEVFHHNCLCSEIPNEWSFCATWLIIENLHCMLFTPSKSSSNHIIPSKPSHVGNISKQLIYWLHYLFFMLSNFYAKRSRPHPSYFQPHIKLIHTHWPTSSFLKEHVIILLKFACLECQRLPNGNLV